MAVAFGVPYLGKIPLDPNLLRACEEGVAVADKAPGSPAVPALQRIVTGAWDVFRERMDGWVVDARPCVFCKQDHRAYLQQRRLSTTAIVESTTAPGVGSSSEAAVVSGNGGASA